MAETKYIVFSLGNQKYGVKLDRINGIEQDYVIVPIPVGAENIKGIIHLREEVIPVFNLKGYFEIDEMDADCDIQLLVAETHGIKLGIEVDKVYGIVSLAPEQIKKLPVVARGEETKYIDGVISTNEYSNNGREDIMLTIAIDNLMSDSDFEVVTAAIEEAK